MTREEYFMCLEGYLKELTYEECKEALQYYENYFDEAGPENEQEVIEQLGSPKQLAETILHSEGIGDGANANAAYEKRKDANVVPYGNNANENNSSYQNTYSSKEANKNVNTTNSNNDSTTRIIIAILIAVIAFPTIIGILGTLFGLICAFAFGGLGLVIGGVAAIVGGVISCFKLGIGMGFMIIGIALILVSIGFLLWFVLYAVCRYLFPICISGIKKLWNWIVGKKEVA